MQRGALGPCGLVTGCSPGSNPSIATASAAAAAPCVPAALQRRGCSSVLRPPSPEGPGVRAATGGARLRRRRVQHQGAWAGAQRRAGRRQVRRRFPGPKRARARARSHRPSSVCPPAPACLLRSPPLTVRRLGSRMLPAAARALRRAAPSAAARVRPAAGSPGTRAWRPRSRAAAASARACGAPRACSCAGAPPGSSASTAVRCGARPGGPPGRPASASTRPRCSAASTAWSPAARARPTTSGSSRPSRRVRGGPTRLSRARAALR